MPFLALVALIALPSAQATPFVFTEQSIQALLKGPIPKIDQIEATLLEAKANHLGQLEKFGYEAYTGASYGENKAQPLIRFQPVYSPTRTAEVGIRKNFDYGVKTSLGASMNQVTGQTPSFGLKNGTTTIIQLGVSIDLWQDLLGRMSKANITSTELARERAEIEKVVQTQAFNLSLRRLYWSFIANDLSKTITETLLEQAMTQAREARKRSVNFVADEAEVARYEAQVSSRRSSLTALQYERENLTRSLMNLVPDLAGRDISVGPADIEATISEVLACTRVIGNRHETPFDFTKYDEMLTLLRREKANKIEANRRSGGPSLALDSSFKTTGVAPGATHNGSIGESISDFNNNNRTGFTVALNAVIPLGGRKSSTEATRELLQERRYDANIRSMSTEVDSTHNQLKNNIKLLVEIIKNQKDNTNSLTRRLAIEKKKFNQARISVQDLVNDQDALLSAELDVISAQFQIMENLFAYLTVFTETPCEFNKKI